MMVMDDQINKEHLNYLATHTPVTDSGRQVRKGRRELVL
jgi:hypothetical protein